ncbi:hypothetical protein EYF80_030341 [Liparis tanakae]|uniref:DUF4592 domain-containing protein n=1 Tax=Liparis tanakae TaxID=230148 RepID=A0A4Z2H0Z4_9TELE|nr:hypothetical protein EYF80_030341 [Liparis tanakae]
MAGMYGCFKSRNGPPVFPKASLAQQSLCNRSGSGTVMQREMNVGRAEGPTRAFGQFLSGVHLRRVATSGALDRRRECGPLEDERNPKETWVNGPPSAPRRQRFGRQMWTAEQSAGKVAEMPLERRGDGAAMASETPDAMDHQEPAEVVEECSAKKKSKFQTFKKFFARKKRKEPPAAGAEAGLKASRSSDNVSKTSQNDTLTRSEEDKGSGSKTSLGSKALSHDSVFVSDVSDTHEALGASQDNIHGKVKSLQLRQAIRLGSPPSLLCVKKTDDAGALSEDDDPPRSPRECAARHTVTNQAERNSFISLVGGDSDGDQNQEFLKA